MSWEWVALIGIVIVVVLAIVFRNKPIVKKNWKYLLILAPAVFIIVLRIINSKKGSSPDDKEAKTLRNAIEKVKDDIVDAQLETTIEVTAAKTQNKEVIKKLKEVKKMPDRRERRKRLAAMIG